MEFVSESRTTVQLHSATMCVSLTRLSSDLQEDFYSASLYFIMTIFTTVGFGNIAPWNASEQIFCVCVMLIGGNFFCSESEKQVATISRTILV